MSWGILLFAIFTTSSAVCDAKGSAGPIFWSRRLDDAPAVAPTHASKPPETAARLSHRHQLQQHASCARKRSINFGAVETEKALAQKEWWHGYLDLLRTSGRINEVFPAGTNILNFVGPLGPFCRRNLTIFAHGDDEKRGCFHSLRTMDELSRAHPSFTAQEAGKRSNESCVVYSIGGNNQWGFEADIFDKTECRIETFDCTINGVIPSTIASRTRFHKVCLGRDDGDLHGKTFLSWSSINALANDNYAPTFLKMDIEGWEHEAISNMLRPPHLASLPMYIAMEVHSFVVIHKNQERMVNNLNSTEMLRLFEALYRVGSYFVVDVRTNAACPWCLEILFARIDCGAVLSSSPSRLESSPIQPSNGDPAERANPGAGSAEARLRSARAKVQADLRSVGPEDAAREIKDMIEASVKQIKLLNRIL